MVNNKYDDKSGRYEINTVTIETVDQACLDYFEQRVKPTVEVERGRKKVPIIFATGERWKLVRDKRGLRDENGVLILPLITLRRVDIDRTPGFGGMTLHQKSITISKIIHGKTPNLQNLLRDRRTSGFLGERKEDKVIREYLTLPFPDFSQIFYEVTIWTQYQSQMNEILEKIFYKYDWMDSFVMPVGDQSLTTPKGNGYYFVGFRDGNVASKSNIEEFSEDERVIQYTYNFKVPVYLLLDPAEDEALAYGQTEDGKNVVYKKQSAVNIRLKENTGRVEDILDILEG